MGTNWTPGPWAYDADNQEITMTDDTGAVIAVVFDGSDLAAAEQLDTDGYLIAAAPDLYAAVREAQCPRPCNGRPDDLTAGACFDLEECGCTFGAALAKADGAA